MEKESSRSSGFRIKWGDIEVEYHGDDSPEVFKSVFEYFKKIPIKYVETQTGEIKAEEIAPKLEEVTISSKMDSAYNRLSQDSKIPKEQLQKMVRFKQVGTFEFPVPYLPSHPEDRDAVLLVTYIIQVGLQRTPIEVSHLKKILKDPNGYPLPGRRLGLILQDFRKAKLIIASQTQKKYKPFTLSTKGLDRARKILKELRTTVISDK